MPAYQYEAITKEGSTNKGTVEADSERQAREFVRNKGLIPTNIHSIAQHNRSGFRLKTITAKDLTLMTRQLATLLAAGIPVEESIMGVSEQTEKEPVRQLLMGVRSKVLEGFSLAQAMGEFPKAFPELYRATVSSGEQTGKLDAVLEKLADYSENQQLTKQKIQQALIYPSLMIIVSTAIISFLLAFVVPKIIEVFTSSGQTLPYMTNLLMQISGFVKQYGLHCVVALIGIAILFKRALRNLSFRARYERILLKLPMISYLIRTTNVARYIHTFGILFAAGVPVLETMRVCASLITNLPMQQAFEDSTVKVREGTNINLALKDTSYIDPMAIHLIASGEKGGQLSLMMVKAAKHLDQEVKRLIDTALTLLEPLVILLMGGVVLFIVLATLLPIFSMEQLIA